MVQAIQSLLSDPGLAGRLSANGRRLAELSSWEQVLPQWEKVFADVMAPGVFQR
jgi:glycosyltransferase involved in cell wall biosynthesis